MTDKNLAQTTLTFYKATKSLCTSFLDSWADQ